MDNYYTNLATDVQQAGLPVTLEKLEGPEVKLTFLGFEIDLVSF